MEAFFWNSLLPFAHSLLIVVLLLPAVYFWAKASYELANAVGNVIYVFWSKASEVTTLTGFDDAIVDHSVRGVFFAIIAYLLTVPMLHRQFGWTFLWWGL